MEPQDTALTTRAAPALTWAQTHFAWQAQEMVADTPWATTLRLTSTTDQAYLKLLPWHQRKMVAPVARLAAHFGDRIPPMLAHSSEHGWMLSAHHGGRTLDYDSEPEDLLAVVRTYGQLQANAATQSWLWQDLPRVDIGSLPELLLQFLGAVVPASDPPSAPVGAAYFIGTEDAARYERLLRRRSSVIATHLQRASALPPTINHGDLRPPNAAVTDKGRCFIMDWDDAMVGPAGMSLQGMFGGGTAPTILLSGSEVAAKAAHTPDGLLLQAFIEALAAGGYATIDTLKRAIPATVCAGVIQFILNFANFPGESRREAVGDTLRSRLSNLLDMCDLLAARDPASAIEYAQDYESRGEFRRAQNLLQDQVARRPNDAAALARFGRICRLNDHPELSLEALREAVAFAPEHADHHVELGLTLLEQLALDEATASFAQAAVLMPTLATAHEGLARAAELKRLRQAAAEPSNVPLMSYQTQGVAHDAVDKPRPEQVAMACELFNTYGALQIDHAFPVETILRLQEAFMSRYQRYFTDDDHPDALRLGDKRFMLTVDMMAPFDDASIFGAPKVLPIIRHLLDDNFVLGAYTAAISLPGSSDQRLHKDHPALYPGAEWRHKLPSFAVQMIVPLVPLDAFTGTTRIYKGSHRFSTDDAEARGHQDPVVPMGSCLLTDFRCAHRGLGNRSDRVRPILTLIYNRPWFRDFKNYAAQPPLRVPDKTFAKLPDDLRPLLAWWKDNGRG